MSVEKKLGKLEKTISVLCIILCLLLVLPSKFELSANASSTSVIVSPPESIQAAINNAAAGDTILVSAGTYNESLIVNKSISLIGEGIDQTIINGQNNQFIINITADNVTMEGFTIQNALNLNPSDGINILSSKGNVISHNKIENSQQGIAVTSSSDNVISDNIVTTNNQQGITFTSCSNNTVMNNMITNTQQGIALTSSSNNTISDNTITANTQGGVVVYVSNNNVFSGNLISNNYGGFSIYYSGGNVFSGNTLAGNYPNGATISYSNFNIFYDNNFYDTIQIDLGLINTWDNGREGNYWSNFAGYDSGDGTSNKTYQVSARNIDRHPLMGSFSGFDAASGGETYRISIISNSTISDFKFGIGEETGNKIIQFNVTGKESTVGFSRIAIPTALMNTSLIVLAGQMEIAPTVLKSQNTALNYLYFTYAQSNQTILMISSKTSDLYNQLLLQFLTLNAAYNRLLDNYTTQSGMLSNYTTQFGLLTNFTGQLNDTYSELLSRYTALLGNYTQLQQSYMGLNYSQNLQNVRSLMYIFAAATAILIVFIVYFSKHVYSRPKEAHEGEEPILSRPISSTV
jgi:parallel beta-helix repeat protein